MGVQADDDLIKVAMDRIALMEKNKRMFYGNSSRAHNGSGDINIRVDGSFSPVPRHSKMPAALMAEELRDFGTNDRVMKPSVKQQRASREFQMERQ